MKVTTHGEHLVQLTQRTPLFPVNCYLVREDDGFTVVDTGLSGITPAMLSTARTLGAPILRIALTHSHMDHVGSLDALHAALPEAEVIISKREAPLLAGNMALEAGEPGTKVRGGFSKVTTRPTRLVTPGERIGSLCVIASPGHTPGHIAFLDERDGALLAGDAFATFTSTIVSGTWRTRFPFSAMATWDKPTALATARTLRALDPSRLAVGHGPVLTNPGTAMDAAITEAARRLREGSIHAA